MDDYQEKLIKLYAKNSVEKISANPLLLEETFGIKLNDLAQVWGFSADQERIQKLKVKVEERSNEFTVDARRQIIVALQILLEMAMFPEVDVAIKMDIMQALFLHMFESWSAQQVKHFTFVCELLKEWDSYFISYTNHNAMVVNDKYKAVIRRNFPRETIKAYREKYNLLAEAIFGQLRKSNLNRGFFDRQNIKAGDDLDGTITPAASKTFAFIQLVQPETFMAAPDRDNWCFKEYQAFLGANSAQLQSRQEYTELFDKRFKAVLAGDGEEDIIPPILPKPFIAWKERIFDKAHHIALPNDPDGFEKAMRDVAYAIADLHNQILSSVPA